MSRRRRATGQQALEAAFAATDHGPLLAILGVPLSDESLKLALSHRSFANEAGDLPNNERLEFLGDAVLGLTIAAKLFEMHPSRPESDISKMRAAIVSRFGLSDIAREIRLGDYILLGKGESATGGSDKDSILADTMEAILGSIYLEHGFETARSVILRLFEHKIDRASVSGVHDDWKTSLQELVAALGIERAEYHAASEGPEHDQLFTASVMISGRILGMGTGPSKKRAEQEAAHYAYDAIRANPAIVRNHAGTS